MQRKVTFYAFGTSKMGADLDDAEVWTMNDWYQFPYEKNWDTTLYYVKPTRVYQIHDDINALDMRMLSGRMIDWRHEYEKSGAEIITTVDIGLSRQRIFEIKRGFEDFGMMFFTSTASYMFAEAIWHGIKEIDLVGFDLAARGEYEHQLPGMISNIETAREHGIKVNAPREELYHDTIKKVKWADIPDNLGRYGVAQSIGKLFDVSLLSKVELD